jgi:quercetin dioxygenase-like cupin family protein
MKKLNQSMIVLSSIFLILLSSCGDEKKNKSQSTDSQEEQIVVEVTPKVLFENNYTKVSKIILAPGEFLPTHEGENRVIYSLTDYLLDWEEKGEQLGAKTWKKGDVHFHEAGTHAAKNIGKAPAEWLVFTKKTNDLPDCGENIVANDVNSVSPDFAETLFENDDFKVTQVNLPKGKSIPTHSGINRIIYSLSDYDLNYESDTENELDKQFKEGDVHWHEACQHALENDGETEANFLVVSYKQKDV